MFSRNKDGVRTMGKEHVVLNGSVPVRFVFIGEVCFPEAPTGLFLPFLPDRARSRGHHLLQDVVNLANCDHEKKKETRAPQPGRRKHGYRVGTRPHLPRTVSELLFLDAP